ncbi:hypothetical protein Bca101_056221 [Brassica carinata]
MSYNDMFGDFGRYTLDSEMYQDYLKLKSRVENLRSLNIHNGQEIARMGVDELGQLERQADTSLRQIRSKKALSMLDNLSNLKTKSLQSWCEKRKQLCCNTITECY